MKALRLYLMVIFVLLILCVFFTHRNHKNEITKELRDEAPLDSTMSLGPHGHGRGSNYLLPLIFVGGTLRSGTTLMRVMMDAHPDIRCGAETGVIPIFLKNMMELLRNTSLYQFFIGAGIVNDELGVGKYSVLDVAVQDFILDIVINFDKPSKNICNKDPCNLSHIKYLSYIFPNSKFVLMFRDLRAVAHSYDSNHRPVQKIHSEEDDMYFARIQFLNNEYENMIGQCLSLPGRCIIQKYEQLVLQPIRETKRLFEFLEIYWTEEILHYDKHLNETSLNPKELSTKQVSKPLYLDSLTEWTKHVPSYVTAHLRELAPVMILLGYDVTSEHPVYGEPDEFVLQLMEQLDDDYE